MISVNMRDVTGWPSNIPLSSFLLPAMVGIALSLFGMPWLVLSEPQRNSRQNLRTRWAIFSWLHPFWAAVIKAGAVFAILALITVLFVANAVSAAA